MQMMFDGCYILQRGCWYRIPAGKEQEPARRAGFIPEANNKMKVYLCLYGYLF